MRATLAVLSVLVIYCSARSPYAGRDPIGYPKLNPTENPLANRFGEDGTPTTTMRLPLEAQGDAELVKRYMKMPMDQWPFWLLNWQAMEADRVAPHTYNQRENGFLDQSTGFRLSN